MFSTQLVDIIQYSQRCYQIQELFETRVMNLNAHYVELRHAARLDFKTHLFKEDGGEETKRRNSVSQPGMWS